MSKYLNSNKQKRSHFHLDISPELNEKLEELAQKIDGTKTDVLRQGITLLHLMLEAKEQGKKFGIAEPDRDISVEIDL
ncbi:MAG: DNA-binding protein [Cyanobacteria bacterium SBLK]|nr:DNA-binding protein [Cyanobacteria bacterium SBLK]